MIAQALSKNKHKAIFPLTLFIALFTLYASTAPRSIALEDDGLFVINSYFLGIAHPPGYPLYILIAKLATLLPFGSVAYRVHLLSAWFGALTCVALWYVAKALTDEKLVAGIAALSYGVSRIFWSQAIIAEVYTLNSFLFFTLLYIAVTVYRSNVTDEKRILKLIAVFTLLLGLALSNHWPLMVLYGVVFPFFFWNVRYLILKNLLRLFPLLLLGLLPYWWMWWRGQQHLPINTIGALPFDSLSELISYIKRETFADVDKNPLATSSDKIQFIAFSIREWCLQYSLLGIPLILIGIIHAWREYDRKIVVNLLLGCSIPQIVLLWKISFTYDYLYINVFKVYPLVGYGIAAIFFAFGTVFILDALRKYSFYGRKIPVGAAIMFILLAVFLSNLVINDRSRYDWAEKYAKSLFELLPPNSSVFVTGDIDSWVLGYYYLVEHLRPDLTFYNGSNIFNNLFFNPDDKAEVIAQKLADFINHSTTPIILASGSDINQFLDIVNPTFGLLAQIATTSNRKYAADTLFDKRQMTNLANLINSQTLINDPWTILHRSQLLRIYDYLAICMSVQPFSQIHITPDDKIAPFYAKLGIIEGYLMCRNDLNNAAIMLSEAQSLVNSEIDKSTLSEYYKYRGEINTIRFGINAGATQDLATSVAIHPSPDNVALQQLLKVYALSGNTAAFNHTVKQYLKNELPAWYTDLQGLLLQKSPSITEPPARH